MSAETPPGAWGGDPERKRQVVEQVRAAAYGRDEVAAGAVLHLRHQDGRRTSGQIFAVAFDTADAAEIEARSGLPALVLRLIGGVLAACEHWSAGRDGKTGDLYVAPAAIDGAARMLEAIPVGADLAVLPQRYLVALLTQLSADPGDDTWLAGSGTRDLLRSVLALHAGDRRDKAEFRALRRDVVRATDAAESIPDRVVLTMLESVAWPIDDLTEELPGVVQTLHVNLSNALGSTQPTADERQIIADYQEASRALIEAFEADPSADVQRFLERMQASPAVHAFRDATFQARLVGYSHVACDEYAPKALALLQRVLRNSE